MSAFFNNSKVSKDLVETARKIMQNEENSEAKHLDEARTSRNSDQLDKLHKEYNKFHDIMDKIIDAGGNPKNTKYPDEAKKIWQKIELLLKQEGVEFDSESLDEGIGSALKSVKDKSKEVRGKIDKFALDRRTNKNLNKMRKNAQKFRKNMGIDEMFDFLDEAVSMSGQTKALIDTLKREWSKVDKIEPGSDAHKRMISLLNKMDQPTLKSVVDAKIKFLSPLALMRVRGNGKKIGVFEEKEFQMWTENDVNRIKSKLNSAETFVSISTLGGKDKPASIFIKGSLDPKSNWINGIFENSAYFHFSIHGDDMKMELLSSGLYSDGSRMPKFRKSKVKGTDDIIAKINKYIDLAKKNISESKEEQATKKDGKVDTDLEGEKKAKKEPVEIDPQLDESKSTQYTWWENDDGSVDVGIHGGPYKRIPPKASKGLYIEIDKNLNNWDKLQNILKKHYKKN